MKWKYALAALPAGMVLAANVPAPRTAGVEVHIGDLRSTKGLVRACLTADPDSFPKCNLDPAARKVAVPAGNAGSIVFKGVQPGRYAIAVLHDENGNGKADRAITMIPKEGFGFSRDAKVSFGPPKFEDAAFTLGTDKREMAIRMRYIL